MSDENIVYVSLKQLRSLLKEDDGQCLRSCRTDVGFVITGDGTVHIKAWDAESICHLGGEESYILWDRYSSGRKQRVAARTWVQFDELFRQYIDLYGNLALSNLTKEKVYRTLRKHPLPRYDADTRFEWAIEEPTSKKQKKTFFQRLHYLFWPDD